MGNYLENVIEKLIHDGIVTESELQQRIEEEKAKSPVRDLNNLGNIEALQMKTIDQLGGIISMLMMQVSALETCINELEGK